MQVTLDLSQVSYVATANSLEPLPGPIRDRFRVVDFPTPTADDLDALLSAVTVAIALSIPTPQVAALRAIAEYRRLVS